jgi:hypothetical protein
MLKDITLQINISPGDIKYADLTIPAIVSKHPDIAKILLIADCCRPQKTKLVNPDIRFPKFEFEKKVEILIEICERLLKKGIVTDVYYFYPEDPYRQKLAKKYLRGLYDCTHGAGGTANMGYWLGLDIPKTRYVLHYDADILIYQRPGFSWVNETINYMKDLDNVLMGVPRLCPPVKTNASLTSLHEERPTVEFENYWLNDWFSTRNFLIDKEKLEKYLPLVQGKVILELLARKYLNRAFPLDPEIIFFRTLSPKGVKRVMLKSESAWLLHPVDKSENFINILPHLIKQINEGKTPDEQRGYENMNLNCWVNFLEEKTASQQ